MIIPLLLAGIASSTSLWAWETHGLRYSPDFELYTQGGFGLYPSPIGRLLGSGGVETFATISCLSAGFLVLFVWIAAGSHWGSAALVFSPALLYLNHAGIDTIGLAFYAAMIAFRSTLAGTVAALTHWTLLPFVLLHLTRSVKPLHLATICFFLIPSAVFVLMVTPYGGIVTGLGLDFFPYLGLGLGVGLVLAAPAIALYRFSPASVCGFLLGAAQVGAQHHLQARYLLPALVLHVCAGQRRTWPDRVIAALTTRGYGDKLRWRSLSMGVGGSSLEASTPTTTHKEVLAPDASHP